MDMKTYSLSYSLCSYLNDIEPPSKKLKQWEVGYFASVLSDAIENQNSNVVVGYIEKINDRLQRLGFGPGETMLSFWLTDVRKELIDAICPRVCEFCKYAKDTGNGNYECGLERD